MVAWLQVNAHVGFHRPYRVCSSRHTFPRPRKSFEYIRLYNQSVPVCSILSVSYTHLDVYKRQMLQEVEAGRVATVITKDLSRLGRNYLKTGELIELSLIHIYDAISSSSS